MKYKKELPFSECPYLTKGSNKCFHKFAPHHCIHKNNPKNCPYYNDWVETLVLMEKVE